MSNAAAAAPIALEHDAVVKMSFPHRDGAYDRFYRVWDLLGHFLAEGCAMDQALTETEQEVKSFGEGERFKLSSIPAVLACWSDAEKSRMDAERDAMQRVEIGQVVTVRGIALQVVAYGHTRDHFQLVPVSQ